MFALSKLTNKFKAARVGVKFNPPTLGIEYNTGNGDEKKALKRVRPASTNLKKNYYTTHKQYMQNRCQTYEQRVFNFQ